MYKRQLPFTVEFTFDEPPVLNQTTNVTVTVRAHGNFNVSAYLGAPESVAVQGNRTWVLDLREGQETARTWPLRVQRDGFWALALRPAHGQEATYPLSWSVGCCLYVYTEGASAAVGREPTDVLPAVRGDGQTSVDTRDEGRLLQITYRFEPKEAWMRHGTLVVQGQASGEGPGSQPLQVTGDYPTEPDTDHAFTHVTRLRVEFASPYEQGTPPHEMVDVDCRVLHLKRHNGNVLSSADLVCGQERSFYMPGAPLGAAALAFLCAALFARRRRPRIK